MIRWWSTASIRVRLTAWYTAVLALMLVVYAAVTFLAVRHEFHEQLELATGEVDRTIAANDSPCDEVHFEVGDFEPKDLRRTTAAQERANPREQLRQRERLHQIIVRSAIQSKDSILDAAARRENEHRCLDVPLSERLENLEPAAAREHQIEHHQVEQLGVRAVEPVLTGGRDDDVVVLGLQCGRQHLRQLPFVLHDQHAHDFACYRPAPASNLTFVSGGSGPAED